MVSLIWQPFVNAGKISASLSRFFGERMKRRLGMRIKFGGRSLVGTCTCQEPHTAKLKGLRMSLPYLKKYRRPLKGKALGEWMQEVVIRQQKLFGVAETLSKELFSKVKRQ